MLGPPSIMSLSFSVNYLKRKKYFLKFARFFLSYFLNMFPLLYAYVCLNEIKDHVHVIFLVFLQIKTNNPKKSKVTISYPGAALNIMVMVCIIAFYMNIFVGFLWGFFHCVMGSIFCCSYFAIYEQFGFGKFHCKHTNYLNPACA